MSKSAIGNAPVVSSPVGQGDPSTEDSIALAGLLADLEREIAAPTSKGPDIARRAYALVVETERSLLWPSTLHALLCAAQVQYLTGSPTAGLPYAELAVRSALLRNDRSAHRRALTVEAVLLADCGNIPLALERYAEALEISQDLRDATAELRVLNNIGIALIYAAQYADAIACLERVIELIGDDPAHAAVKEAAQTNIALACIHTEDLARGLRAAKASVAGQMSTLGGNEVLNRVIAERNYVRLLVEVDNIQKARERCELAKQAARIAGTPKAMLQAELAEGLCEVHAGLIDVGLSRLDRALALARSSPPALRDTLLVLVRASEVAGKPEKALEHLQELKSHTREVQQENALLHHRLHLARLEHDPVHAADHSQTIFRRHERLIEGQQAQQKLLKAQIEQLERLAVTAELRDDSTGEHSYRVGRLAALLAREAGLDEQTCFTIDLAARLHDIGKIGIPDGILLKPGHLNAAEREIMETHTTVGAELLAKSDIPHMQVAEDIARFHHEWWAGGGYPAGISGDAIPIAARVTALADVFDALTHKRPYKEPWPVARALDEIQRLRGSQFDPKLTDIFIGLIHRLQREVGDLDEFLGAAARESSFNQARNRIAETLRRHPERRAYERGLDPRL